MFQYASFYISGETVKIVDSEFEEVVIHDTRQDINGSCCIPPIIDVYSRRGLNVAANLFRYYLRNYIYITPPLLDEIARACFKQRPDIHYKRYHACIKNEFARMQWLNTTSLAHRKCGLGKIDTCVAKQMKSVE